MKYDKKDYRNLGILLLIFLIILFLVVGFNKINGSTIDWSSQHWVMPEYFRNLFYDTNDLFPSFAFNIGGGQNIYNLSYYGLLSPITLISYALPFLSMINYIQLIMILVVGSSIILMYYWLKKRFDSKYAFIGTLLFLLSAPLIYHTHKHIMFINYMPFLLMGLIAVDRYFEKGKSTLLVISVFLIIMSSYYYSVGSIICILMYGIFKYLELNEKVKIKNFLIDGLKFVFPIFLGIGLSAVLIFPTFYALLNGRSDITQNINIYELMIPTLNINQMQYTAYTIGLTNIFIFAIIWGLFKNKSIKFISIIFAILFIFPIFMYILSGFMYERGKVLIPLLPLAVLLVNYLLDKLTIRKNKAFNMLIIVVTLIEIYIHIKLNQALLIIDIVILTSTYLLYLKYKNKNIIIYPLCVCALICCLVNNYTDKLENKNYLNEEVSSINYNRLSMIERNEYNIYRVSNDLLGIKDANRIVDISYLIPSIYSSLGNQNYFNFANSMIGNEMESNISTAIMSSKNILFNTYMGTKYIITNKDVPIGYSNVIGTNIYFNDYVLPIGYSTSKVMSYEEYNELNYPDNIYALLSNIVVDSNVESNFISRMIKETPKYKSEYKNIVIEEKVDEYLINAEEDASMTIDLNKKYDNKILLISFDMKYNENCQVGDTSITINGVKNTLSCKEWIYPNRNNTFQYVISSNDIIENLSISFSKGKYEISNINMYSIDYKYITDFTNSINEFKIDKTKTKGDKLYGEINVEENGYFIISIPYEEKGFEIYVNNKRVEYEKVDNAFIGFPIHEGNHEIIIKYTSPYLKEGMIVTLCSSMILLPLIYTDLFYKKKRK